MIVETVAVEQQDIVNEILEKLNDERRLSSEQNACIARLQADNDRLRIELLEARHINDSKGE